MPARKHPQTIAIALLVAVVLSACSPHSSDPVLTLEGTLTGTTSDSCQMALRAADSSLVDSHSVGPSFRQEFAVAPGKGNYHVEIRCPDGKSANIDGFDFEPPRATIKFGEIPLT